MNITLNIDEELLKKNFKADTVTFSYFLDKLRDNAPHLYKKNNVLYPTYILDDKLIGYSFAQICGIPTAKILQVGVSLAELDFVSRSVIKPIYGSSSKGVFIAHSQNNIVYLNKNTSYPSSSRARSYARQLLREKIVTRDSWMTEELLVEKDSIARDIKFYCFYGKVGLILETGRVGEIKRCWYDEDLNYINTGKYDSNLFKGDRTHLAELKKMASEISLEIPAPFIRIDFLVSNGEYYLGEFTPIPANYSDFEYKWDTYLGGLYAEAMLNLSYDVSIGKVFDKYNKLDKNRSSLIRRLQIEISKRQKILG